MTHRATKIVATLGPASSEPALLEDMIRAGVNVVRLNFSHGTAQDHIDRARLVREVAERAGREVAIMADLQGPKIRVGKFAEGKVQLLPGAPFVLDAARNDPPQAWALINKFSFAPAAVLGEQRRLALEAANLERMQKQGAAVLATDLAACDGWQDGLQAATRVRCPVLLVSGDCDRMTPADAVVPLRDAFSACDARLIVLPGVGHALMQEAPQPLVDAMLAAS